MNCFNFFLASCLLFIYLFILRQGLIILSRLVLNLQGHVTLPWPPNIWEMHIHAWLIHVSLFIFKFEIHLFFVCLLGEGYTCALAYTWIGRSSLWELVLSYPGVMGLKSCAGPTAFLC